MRPHFLVLAAVLLPVPALSQQHPDFSGVWTRGAAFEVGTHSLYPIPVAATPDF